MQNSFMTKYRPQIVNILDIISAAAIIMGAFLKITNHPLGLYLLTAGFWLMIIVGVLKTVEIRSLKAKIKKLEEIEA